MLVVAESAKVVDAGTQVSGGTQTYKGPPPNCGLL